MGKPVLGSIVKRKVPGWYWGVGFVFVAMVFTMLFGGTHNAPRAVNNGRIADTASPIYGASPKPQLPQEPGIIRSMRRSLLPGGWGATPGQETDVDGCILRAAEFLAQGKMIADANDLPLSPDQKNLIGKFKVALLSRQAAGLPRLRARYGKLLGEKLWSEDITVRIFGKANRSIEFVGGLFLAHKNIQTFMEATNENLSAMRFSTVRFRGYDGGEFTYYELKTPKDDELGAIN